MTAEFPVSHDVEYELTRLLRRSRVRGMRTVEQIHPDLDFASYLLMVAIYESQDPVRAGVRGSELAGTFGVHKSTISRGLSSLERLGLVERVPDPTDGRARLVTLSDHAASRIEAVRAQRHQQLAQALADWEPDDLAAFAQLLQRLNSAYD
ncbi:MAG: MarR family winged helix-turn-helix transcriptional regulator [Nocardioidaceae bacterium]